MRPVVAHTDSAWPAVVRTDSEPVVPEHILVAELGAAAVQAALEPDAAVVQAVPELGAVAELDAAAVHAAVVEQDAAVQAAVVEQDAAVQAVVEAPVCMVILAVDSGPAYTCPSY